MRHRISSIERSARPACQSRSRRKPLETGRQRRQSAAYGKTGPSGDSRWMGNQSRGKSAGARRMATRRCSRRRPFTISSIATIPRATLSASGEDVGLPDGQMGNSEVGHLNLGAGRIVYQDLTRINKAIADGELQTECGSAGGFRDRRAAGRLHFIGLVSDGGVHSHLAHLIALAEAAKEAGVEQILVHAITDGRDASPTGGADYLATCAGAAGAERARRSSPSSVAISRWTATGAGSGRNWPGTRSCSGAARFATDSPAAAVSAALRGGQDGRVHARADLCPA